MAIIPPRINNTDWAHKWANGEMQISQEHLMAEMQLLALGNFIPLSIKINTHQFNNEISKYSNDWCPYLQRSDRVNNRQALSIVTFPGFKFNEAPSLPEVAEKLGRKPLETDCTEYTEVYSHCTSLHPVLNLFPSLGRTFLVKCNMGGYFVPHRDHPQLNRDVFRILVFLKNCKRYEYDFLFDDKSMEIEEGRAYVVNTRLTHRTFSFVDDSTHLIMNIPVTMHNVMTVLSNLQHRH